MRPRRIVLIRHGESAGNLDEAAYTRVPDWRIDLTPLGEEQSTQAGRDLQRMLAGPQAKAYFYHSPYQRTRRTLELVLREVDPAKVVGRREEPRISEQQFGNLQDVAATQRAKAERKAFGRFYYRFPLGESALDVYSRVTSFLATVHRDMGTLRAAGQMTDDTHFVIVSHGLCIRTFLMRWFQLTVSDFEAMSNPPNASLVVMERRANQAGQQWYELTAGSWALLNAEGRIDLKTIRASGGWPGAPRRRLVISDDDALDG